MKIHYYMQFFPGANAVGTQQPISLAKTLADRGHSVSVISADYNLDSGMQESSVELPSESGGCVHVLRVPSMRGGRGSNAQRLVSYMHFMCRAALRGLFAERPDVIIGSIQPMFTGLAALAVARRAGVPFVLEVRDLWPDALVVKNAIGPITAKPLHWVVELLYNSADRIISLTPGIKTELLKKGVDPLKIDVFPNGFDPGLFLAKGIDNRATRARYGWTDELVAIYTGSFTRVTAIETIIKAAGLLSGRKGIRFALFGQGPTRKEMESLTEQLEARNVDFYEPVPKIEVPALLAAADIALMSLFESPLIHIYFENKLMDYMGAGKPIFAAMAGVQADLIRKFNTGVVVGAFDSASLAGHIERAMRSPEKLKLMGANGRDLVYRRLLAPEILERYAQTVEAVATKNAWSRAPWEPFSAGTP